MWELFGLPVTGWDPLAYVDFLWMREQAEEHVRQVERASKAGE